MAQQRLGSWQRDVLARIGDTPVTYSSVRPRGRAAAYGSRYERSFLRLANVPGYEVGQFGPHGGLAIRRVD